MSSKKYRIAVAGFGAAGAVSAICLAQQGHEVTLFDQMAKLKPVGAGVLLQPSGQMILAAMGLLEPVIKNAEPIERLVGFTRRGTVLDDLPYAELDPMCLAYGLHRADLFSVLYPAVTAAGVHVKFGCRVDRTRTEKNAVLLLNPEEEVLGDFDFLLACDGARSTLRQRSGIRVWEFGYRHGALWAIGRCESIRRKLHQNTVGSRILCGLLPMGQGRCSLFWSMHENHLPAWQKNPLDQWKREVLRISPQAEELLSGLTTHEDLRFTTYRHVVMSSWYRDRTLFLGDAAHAFSPHTGQGINLALIDAWVFSECLRESPDFKSACGAYSRTRENHLRFNAFITLSLAPFFQSGIPLLGWGRDLVLPLMQRVPFIRRQMILAMSGLKSGFLSGRLTQAHVRVAPSALGL